MKSSNVRAPRTWVASILTGMVLAAVPAVAQGPAAGAEKGIRFEEADGMAAVLKRLEGRPVKLRLSGHGEELSGKIAKVGKELVHVTDLTGREFYDAVIRIDQVAAVVVQVRGR